MRVHLDTAPVIYLVEGVQPFEARINTIIQDPGIEVVASDLTRLECRVRPIRDRSSTLLADFDDFFS